jgi:methyl-accepting chemotaxis protein
MAKQMVSTTSNEKLDARQLLNMLVAIKKGDFSIRLPATWTGVDGKIADTLNDIAEMMSESTREIERVSRVVGREGKLSQRVSLPVGRGAWKSRVDAVNDLIENLVRPTAEMARVIGAVAKGNLTQTVALEAEGQPLRENSWARRAWSMRWSNNSMLSPAKSLGSPAKLAPKESSAARLWSQALPARGRTSPITSI